MMWIEGLVWIWLLWEFYFWYYIIFVLVWVVVIMGLVFVLLFVYLFLEKWFIGDYVYYNLL